MSANLAFWFAVGCIVWVGLGGVFGSLLGKFIHDTQKEEPLQEDWNWPNKEDNDG